MNFKKILVLILSPLYQIPKNPPYPSFPSEFKAESPGNLDITISQEQSAEQRTISSDFELDSISLKASDKIEPWPGNEAPE